MVQGFGSVVNKTITWVWKGFNLASIPQGIKCVAIDVNSMFYIEISKHFSRVQFYDEPKSAASVVWDCVLRSVQRWFPTVEKVVLYVDGKRTFEKLQCEQIRDEEIRKSN